MGIVDEWLCVPCDSGLRLPMNSKNTVGCRCRHPSMQGGWQPPCRARAQPKAFGPLFQMAIRSGLSEVDR